LARLLLFIVVKDPPGFLLESFVLFEADPNHQEEYHDQNDHDACADVHVLLVRVLLLHHPQHNVLGHPARLHPPILFSLLQIAATAVQVDFQCFLNWLMRAERQHWLLLFELVLVELSCFDSVKIVEPSHTVKGECLQSWNGDFTLRLKGFREAVLLSIPKDVE
jgi:hypothetical protein